MRLKLKEVMMIKINTVLTSAVILALMSFSAVQAKDTPVTSTTEITSDHDAREFLMKGYKHDMGILSKEGKADTIDRAVFLAAAKSLADNAPKQAQHYSVGSDKGSDAKADIWKKPLDFKKASDNFEAATQALATAAAKPKLTDDDLRKAVSNVGATCKACHDQFRK
jgi:cytochrome c556